MNPFQVVRDFEKAMAEFTGAPYAIAVESCSIALEMCCHCAKVKNKDVVIPKRTYPSVPAAIIKAGGKVIFSEEPLSWQEIGWYKLRFEGADIIDSAKCIERDMFVQTEPWTLTCLSFHARKVLPIGRGGMILTHAKEWAEWFRCARHDGRHDGISLMNDKLAGIGWNALMTPEQAARGLTLMPNLKNVNIAPPEAYPDLSEYEFFTKANRE